jgi:hypothetical protein
MTHHGILHLLTTLGDFPLVQQAPIRRRQQPRVCIFAVAVPAMGMHLFFQTCPKTWGQVGARIRCRRLPPTACCMYAQIPLHPTGSSLNHSPSVP